MNLRRLLTTGFIVTFVVLLVTGFIVYREQQRRTERDAAAHLEMLLMLRESVLRGFLESLRSEVILWSSQPSVVGTLTLMAADLDASGTNTISTNGDTRVGSLGGTRPEFADQTIDERVRNFAKHHRYHDVFFISRDGHLLYSLTRESRYGTNLVDGPLSDSGLGRLVRELKTLDGPDQVIFEDYSRFAPAGGEPEAFMGSPVYAGDELIGFYAVEIPPEPITSIMQFTAGMGETGETYLVGRDGLMRSDSRFFDESTILETSVSGETVDLALAGKNGVSIIEDYRGVPVYSAYRPFDFEGTRWAVLAEQDVSEIDAPVEETLKWILAGYATIFLVGLLLRFMLVHAVVPAALVGVLGLSLFESIESIDDD